MNESAAMLLGVYESKIEFFVGFYELLILALMCGIPVVLTGVVIVVFVWLNKRRDDDRNKVKQKEE